MSAETSPDSPSERLKGAIRSWLSGEPSLAVSGALSRLYGATECSCPPTLAPPRRVHWASCRSQWRRDVEIIAEALEGL